MTSPQANDDYNSYSLYVAMSTYIWQINENNSISPELGLSCHYSGSDEINFNFAGYSVYNMEIEGLSYHALYATAAIN